MNLSRELMQLCLGTLHNLSAQPSGQDWKTVLEFAERQTVVPLMAYAAARLPQQYRPDEKSAKQLLTALQANGIKASALGKAADAFIEYAAGKGFPSCILKGISLAEYYPDPDIRQCGDLDVWVGGRRDDVIAALRKDFDVQNILWQECHLQFWEGVTVDVHYYPTKAANPLFQRRLLKYYRAQMPVQTSGKFPSLEFDLVYCLAHLYRHALRTGVNFRQIMDYAFLLKASTAEQRRCAYDTAKWLGMKRIAADMMFVLSVTLGLDSSMLLCLPSSKGGKKLVEDALEFRPGCRRPRTLKGELRMFFRYPDELFWTPGARIGQFLWKICKKYL